MKILNINLIIFLIFFIFGIFFCYQNSYTLSDDAYSSINSFLGIINNNQYIPSRPPSYIISEIIMGFLAYYFGSFFLNLVIYIFTVVGLLLFFYSLIESNFFSSKKKKYKLFFFLLLCISNWVIFRNSTLAEDYSIPFFFLSLGLFFFKKNFFELSLIAFAISIGARLNFYLFILIVIFFFKNNGNALSLQKRIILFFSVTFIGGLFYLPIWFLNGFKLNWITGDMTYYYPPVEGLDIKTDQGLKGILGRFFYKIFYIIGFIQSFIIFIYFYYKKINILKIKKIKFIILLLFSNLLIFIYLPFDLNYLWIYLISLYFIISITFDKFIVYSLVIMNLISWFYNFNILEIKYKFMSICEPKYATEVKFIPNFVRGFIFSLKEEKLRINCFNLNLELKNKFLEGKPLK